MSTRERTRTSRYVDGMSSVAWNRMPGFPLSHFSHFHINAREFAIRLINYRANPRARGRISGCLEARRNVSPFSTFDASVSERPLTELRGFPSYSAVPRPPRPSSRMRDVEAGESERLYRPARPGPVERREPSDFGKLRFRFKWQIAANPWQNTYRINEQPSLWKTAGPHLWCNMTNMMCRGASRDFIAEIIVWE